MALMRFRERTVQRLVELPESGMGYQIIRYRNQPYFVFHAELVIPFFEFRERKLSETDFLTFSGERKDTVPALDETDFEDNFELHFSSFGQAQQDSSLRLVSNESAIEPPSAIVSPKIPYSYYRFCASYADPRVRADGSFVPGTYATTFNDIHHVPSGFAAVGRYALPNPASARFVHQIVTMDRPTLMGAAAPNFGQAGGGVEVFFGNGATNRAGYSFRIDAG